MSIKLHFLSEEIEEYYVPNLPIKKFDALEGHIKFELNLAHIDWDYVVHLIENYQGAFELLQHVENDGTELFKIDSKSGHYEKKCLEMEYQDGFRSLGIRYFPFLHQIDEECLLIPIVSKDTPFSGKGRQKALFLDRDGIINEDKGYVYQWENIEWMPGIFDLLKWAVNNSYLIIVVTNQSGVGKGFYKEEDVQTLHQKMNNYLSEMNINIAKWYYSPWHVEGNSPFDKISHDRKPGPGMVLKAWGDFNINFEQSVMVGDKLSDRLNGIKLDTYFIKGKYPLEGVEDRTFDGHLELLKVLEGEKC